MIGQQSTRPIHPDVGQRGVLDADLREASRLNTADHHVLVLLSEQPEHALRPSERLPRKQR
jgi:hypothetical protein